MPKTDILKATVSVSSNFVWNGFKRALWTMGFAGAVGALFMVVIVAVIAAIVK
jgi:hypothetical protein